MLIATSVQTIFGEKFVLKTSVDSPAVLLLLLVSEKRKIFQVQIVPPKGKHRQVFTTLSFERYWRKYKRTQQTVSISW